MKGRPDDYARVVREAWRKTRVFVLGDEPPCLQIRDEVARPKGRAYHTERLDGIQVARPDPRSVIVVVLCPRTDLSPLVGWLDANLVRPERVLFVVHPDTDIVDALRPWYNAGHPDPLAVEASSFRACAAVIGRFVNDWIYRDERGPGFALTG